MNSNTLLKYDSYESINIDDILDDLHEYCRLCALYDMMSEAESNNNNKVINIVDKQPNINRYIDTEYHEPADNVINLSLRINVNINKRDADSYRDDTNTMSNFLLSNS